MAILLSALITFGNLGESSELTAIKAAGISLMQTFRPLIIIVLMISCISYYFQDVIGPKANLSFYQMLLSVKHKSPELEIPEGVFYDGLPGSNIYVQKKNMDTGMLYGIMIYRQTGSYEDQAIILADSGMMQTTEEKKHLLLTLYSGEWFENMRSQDLANSANIPYRRETFSTKRIVIDFDSGLNMTDMADIAGDARMKPLNRLLHDIDSIKEHNDSVGYSFYTDAKRYSLRLPEITPEDSVKMMKELATDETTIDSIYERQSPADRQAAVKSALSSVQSVKMDMEMKADYAYSLHRYYRHHQLEAIKKFTLSLSCLIFFFIGAPLGAIIRKGGLGVPVIVSVLVFIIYYIFDKSGYKMAREGEWTVAFGMTISTWTLAPVAAFFTYKANKDSVVFNIDLYKQIVSRILGLRTKRNITRKEVIIEDPKYLLDAEMLKNISIAIERYGEEHHLLRWPNPIKVFFHSGDDHDIESINNVLETAIEDLSYTRNNYVLMKLSQFPVIATHAHTRPFQRKWLNAITGLFLPTGLFFYIRMIRFRIRLYRDLQHIIRVNNKLIPRVVELGDLQAEKSNT